MSRVACTGTRWGPDGEVFFVCDTKLIFLGVTTNWDQVQQAFRGGASGYLLKTSEVNELSQAVREVLKGQAYLTPLVTQNLGPLPHS